MSINWTIALSMCSGSLIGSIIGSLINDKIFGKRSK